MGGWLGEADREAEEQPLSILQGEEQIEGHGNRVHLEITGHMNHAGGLDLRVHGPAGLKNRGIGQIKPPRDAGRRRFPIIWRPY